MGDTPEEELATLMNEYGDLTVTASTATDIIEGGDFVVLLDALNEDRHPEATFRFLRKARKRNLVMLSTQFCPSWPSTIPFKRLELGRFGRTQLAEVLPEDWVDKVVDAPHLSAVASLPITALLLREYILRNGSLPASDFAIYMSLRKGLNPNKLLNLEQRAWDLFKNNSEHFKADERIPEDFCESAVRNSVLTRRSVADEIQFQFVHERVHRFFVACFLARQDNIILEERHNELDQGLGRLYWADVLEFIGATYAASDLSLDHRTQIYVQFLRHAAEFAPEVFAVRLYPQYRRYRESGEVDEDAAFQDWSATFLASQLVARRSSAILHQS